MPLLTPAETVVEVRVWRRLALMSCRVCWLTFDQTLVLARLTSYSRQVGPILREDQQFTFRSSMAASCRTWRTTKKDTVQAKVTHLLLRGRQKDLGQGRDGLCALLIDGVELFISEIFMQKGKGDPPAPSRS
jgi:hypothetical protein